MTRKELQGRDYNKREYKLQLRVRLSKFKGLGLSMLLDQIMKLTWNSSSF